ncbi:MAG: hypothetical protein Q8S00_21145 [Deltaproteobacteria bacterium]|nr:hypothetical protein [Deltaproteobacteria bacterium]MDZ4342835.1 hypothetical protein [Candidatus Binatia bacterium]
MSQHKKSVDRKITLIASTGANQTIDHLFRDRNDLEWLLAIGRNCDGEIYFYDSGGDIIEDLGILEYIKERVRESKFGKSDS